MIFKVDKDIVGELKIQNLPQSYLLARPKVNFDYSFFNKILCANILISGSYCSGVTTLAIEIAKKWNKKVIFVNDKPLISSTVGYYLKWINLKDEMDKYANYGVIIIDDFAKGELNENLLWEFLDIREKGLFTTIVGTHEEDISKKLYSKFDFIIKIWDKTIDIKQIKNELLIKL